MSGVADKARFYLERSVPQLREWEDKEIFNKGEIRTIVQKRNQHEIKVLSPGNQASEWSTYAKWEQSLESLKSKRCQRLKIRNVQSAHSSQARVLAIYQRAVNRHPASGNLWREYLAYAASINAAKRWRRTMTSALRMMPTDPELWIMAGRRSLGNGDMASSRTFFMRGCRFCAKDSRVWIEYARCEMEWLEKVDKRKKHQAKHPLRPDREEDGDQLPMDDSGSSDEDEVHSQGLAEPWQAQVDVVEKQISEQLESNPAMDGAIVMAIFDISRKQFFFNAEVAELFFIMFASFRQVSVQPKICQHVLGTMDDLYPNDACTWNCRIQEPILGIDPRTAEFPRNLREVLVRLEAGLTSTTDKTKLQDKTVAWINGYLGLSELDEGISTALQQVKLNVTEA
ncbi:hypothetical protein CDD82_4218 [Ophiocordyceps australis]|uniref:U3 small nucleolar RNA-associated protein 6 N-terminal domain-containing protein n=1 Tax=Ophiocordyceps australis TaxID=1399860 RepID=A0A2C5Z4I6_9HYPO|nr:hypothetical protein CDD82_4218 [Ophiocordyceps australis]